MINRKITIARKNNIIIKQSDDDRFFLTYNNSEIVFSFAGFQQLLNQLDIINKKNIETKDFDLKIYTGAYTGAYLVTISSEDTNDLVELLSEVAAKRRQTCKTYSRNFLLQNLFNNRLN